MRRLLLAGLAILAVGLGYAWAQLVIIQSLSGLEAWQVGSGPAGPGFYTTTKAMRGAKTYSLVSGTTVTTTISPTTDIVVITGAITTLTLSLPTAPFDQQTFTITCPGGIVNSLVLSGPTAGNFLMSPTSNFATCAPTPAAPPVSMYATYMLSAGAGSALSPATSGTWFRIQ